MANKTYLAHFGIQKMKWGIRNGPPYPLKDSQRSASEKRANPESKSSKQMNDDGDNKKDSKDPRNYLKNTTSDADNFVKGVSKLVPHPKQEDLSKYSDADLQRIINRQRLEQQYRQLNPDVIDRGANYTRELIQTIGAGASIILTYEAIKKMKG